MKSRKKIVLGIALITIVLFSILFISTSRANETAVVSLNPPSINGQSVGLGGSFTVTVQVSGVSNLWGWSLGLSWDPSILQMSNSISEGSFLRAAGQTSLTVAPIDNNNGALPNVNDVLTSQDSVSGSGDLVTFTFKIVGYGSTQIDLTNVELLSPAPSPTDSNPQIPSTENNAAFAIDAPQVVHTTSVSSLSDAVLSAVQSGTTSVSSISLPSIPNPIGTTVAIDIRIDGSTGFWAWTLPTVTWNPAVLQLTKVVEGPFLADNTGGDPTTFIGNSKSLYDNTHGLISGGLSEAILAEDTSTDASGVLATLTFTVVGPGTSPVTIGGANLRTSGSDTTGVNVNCNSATVTVAGSISTYSFVFSESGLPSGTSWSVNLAGTTLSSTTGSITFSGLVATSYSYSVAAVSGYSASPASGTITVTGSGQSQAVTFTASAVTYSFVFSESGLPSGTSWSVNLAGTTLSSTTGSITFSGLVATSYSYSVAAVSGYSASPASGTITVTGSGQSQAVTFTASAVTYSFVFSESGLPSGTSWSVNLAGTTLSSTTGSITFSGLVATSYSYSVAAVSGYSASPASGTITVTGSGQSQAVTFTASAVTYSFVFSESGLPSGTSWSVNLAGTTLSSTTGSITFSGLVATSYSYSVAAVSGYSASPASGTITVTGSGQSQAVTFTASAVTYSFVFSESGLPSGTSWSVNLAGTTLSSTTGSITFSGLVATSYSYSVAAVSGYSASPASGTITVTGSGQSQAVTFTSSSSTSSTSTHSPTAIFSPINGTAYAVGGVVMLDASSSTPGYDASGASAVCPISNYAWLVQYLDGTTFASFSGPIITFPVTIVTNLKIILIVTSTDPIVPPSPSFTNTSVASAIIQIVPAQQNAVVDVFTNKGGVGQNVISDAYGPQELVQMYGLVTYNGAPVVNKDVSFVVRNGDGVTIATRVGRTNDTGIAYAEYRLPWPDTSIPEVVFGNWSIVASVDVSQVVVTDTVSFIFNYILNINANGIQLPASIQRGSAIPLSVTIQNIADSVVLSTVTITVYDNANVAIGVFTATNINPINGTSVVTASILIPTWAFVGKATVYVDVLTNVSNLGGVPYCPEKTANFQIVQ